LAGCRSSSGYRPSFWRRRHQATAWAAGLHLPGDLRRFGYGAVMTSLRLGILGAARIAPAAVVKPARVVPGASVDAVAARDPERARAFAARHGIGRVHADYGSLVADPELDAVYIPLPNGLHAQWTLAAVAAGKHVLCEKPFTANAVEARQVANAAESSGLVVMEAFHYRYHPLMTRVLDILSSGELGSLRHMETSLCFPLLRRGDIRWRLDLAGGATMDAGCYPVHCLRTLAQSLVEPTVVSAEAKLRSPDVDRFMTATFRFPGGVTGRIVTSMWSARVLSLSARVVGEAGELRVFNYLMPNAFHRLSVRSNGRVRRETVAGESTYVHQLRAFADAVRHGRSVPTDARDAVRTMNLIDDVYRAAGLRPRTGTVA
jgi:predicted dehydrogenase